MTKGSEEQSEPPRGGWAPAAHITANASHFLLHEPQSLASFVFSFHILQGFPLTFNDEVKTPTTFNIILVSHNTHSPLLMSPLKLRILKPCVCLLAARMGTGRDGMEPPSQAHWEDRAHT